MKNAAGDKNCDDYIRQELTEAGIPFEEWGFLRDPRKEVSSAVVGFLDGWEFRRAWYYWVATSMKTVLLFRGADALHEKFGEVVRVNGDCGCPSPREGNSQPWAIGVSVYHVDTQEGLNALAEAIKAQTESVTPKS